MDHTLDYVGLNQVLEPSVFSLVLVTVGVEGLNVRGVVHSNKSSLRSVIEKPQSLHIHASGLHPGAESHLHTVRDGG